MERAAEVEPPPELVTRILFDPPWAKPRARPGAGFWERWRAFWQPILQPRFAMGMAMTILSFAMLARFVNPVRQLRPKDLDPAAVWRSVDDRVYRAWQRTVKFYESMRLVYQIQSTVREWQQQEDSETANEADATAARPTTGGCRCAPRARPQPGRGPGKTTLRGRWNMNYAESSGNARHGILPHLRQAYVRRMPAHGAGGDFCDEHVPAAAAPPPVRPRRLPGPPGPAADVSPGLACLLGFIPGVGAIYNGQYAKGLVHAVIFGLIVSIMDSGGARGMEPLFGILLTALIFYMAFEAYHTARKRRAGEPVDEFSSLVDLHGRRGTFPVGALVLIALGVILLLNTWTFCGSAKLSGTGRCC